MTQAEVVSISTAKYERLEARIERSDNEALELRWEFGSMLRHTEDDPREVAQACGISAAEAYNRKQFATEYRKNQISSALENFGSWHGIEQHGLGKRKPKPKRDPDYRGIHVRASDKQWQKVNDIAEQSGQAPADVVGQAVAELTGVPYPMTKAERHKAATEDRYDDCGYAGNLKTAIDHAEQWNAKCVVSARTANEKRAVSRMLKKYLNKLNGATRI